MSVSANRSAARESARHGAAKPPFRADHVGSFLRPLALEQARARFRAGELDAAGLRRAEDAAIADIVAYQQALGFKVVSDGEFRRAYFHIDFLEQIGGVSAYQDAASTRFHTSDGQVLDFSPPKLRVDDKLSRPAPIAGPDYAALSAIAGPEVTAKITIPSPTMALRGGRKAVSEAAYPDLDAYSADLAAVYRAEVADLAAAGCRYLQYDDTNLAYLCDPTQRQIIRDRGGDPAADAAAQAKLINDSLAGKPADLFTAIHLCRGNFRSAFVAEGGYEPVAETLLGAIEVDAFLLEYDDVRSGNFEPLRFTPKDRYVVLGLISTKTAELESKDEVKRRVDEAAKYVPLDQLCLSPQCGFASTEHGNNLSFDDQRRKLELVVECAEEIWGG
jgi:5-methyltetrahydropteroyltriglutamate--homocysteine methyltransferase